MRVSAISRRVRSSVKVPWKNSLPRVSPGETTLAVIPRGPSSRARLAAASFSTCSRRPVIVTRSPARTNPAAISQRVARAEGEGLVRRQRSDADGRLSYVTLTAAGHALVERSVDGLLEHEEALLSALTSEQRGQLSGQLKVLLASLSPYPGHLYNERRGVPPALPSTPRL